MTAVDGTPPGPDPSGKDRAWVSLECTEPGCGEVVWGWERGRSSAAYLLGSHRYVKHGKRADGRKKARPAEPDVDELAGDAAGGRVVSLVRSSAATVSGMKRVPSADDLAAALGRGLGLGIMAAAVHVVENDAGVPDEAKDPLIDRLSLTDKAARDVMAPFGRLLAPSRINQRFGRQIVDNADALGSIAELASLASSWRSYLNSRRERAGAPFAAAPAAAQAAYPEPSAEWPEPSTFPPAAPDVTTPGPVHGHIVDGEQVRAMMERRAREGHAE